MVIEVATGDGTNDGLNTHHPFGVGKFNFPGLLHALQPAVDDLEWRGIGFCFCRMTEAEAPNGVLFLQGISRQHYNQ